MKKIITLTLMIIATSITMAQWEVGTYDNGFDKPIYYGYASVDAETPCFYFDKQDNIKKNYINSKLYKFGDTPILIFDYWCFSGYKHNNFQNVTITFKVNGVNKKYNVVGIEIGWKEFVISTDSIIDNISKVMQGQFLSDFKNASKMKIEIKNCNDVYVDDVFNMRGSTNAYNKVKTSSNDDYDIISTIYKLNKLLINAENKVDISGSKYYNELRRNDKDLILDCNGDEINIGDTVQHIEDGYSIVVTDKVDTHRSYYDKYMAVGKLVTKEGDNNADDIPFEIYNPKKFKKL